jgi:Protein of unknown function, DUF481
MVTAEQAGRTLKPLVGGIIAVLLAGFCLPTHAQRPDVVVMKNGDHFTCSLKKLENGMLYVDTDYISGSTGLDWAQVARVESQSVFQITLDDGTRSVGTIQRLVAGNSGAEFIIKSNGMERRTSAASVVHIQSQKPNFWRQLSGGIDVGYDFTSGNSQASLTTDANAKYQTTKWMAGLSDTTQFSGQSASSRTNLIDFTGQEALFFKENWGVLALEDFLHSSQQNLDLRTTWGGGIGRYLFRTNTTWLALIGGTVYTRERYSATSQLNADQNIEGLAGFQYDLLRFNRFSLDSQVFIFPGLSDLGRVRATPKLTFDMKLENNFYTNLSFWDNYDSRPPPNSKGNEFGISSGIGWTF